MISKERLIKEQRSSGYRQEMIEKVVWLIHVLNALAQDSFLKNRLVLKGGTALNLFYFDLPRLSVDVDLNYIGAIEKEIMIKERPEVMDRIYKILQRMGLSLLRNPQVHAGGKMIWKYTSALGNQGTLEIDLNFMYRVPLLPVMQKNSVMLAGQQVDQLLLLDFHELAAGKFCALIDRGAGRDLFDAYYLFQHKTLDIKKLRFCFVIYAAMNRQKRFIDVKIKDILANTKDFKNKLLPVVSAHSQKKFPSPESWFDYLSESVQSNFAKLLPFNHKERLFIESIHNHGEIKPELLTHELGLIEKVKRHPALLWASSPQYSKW